MKKFSFLAFCGIVSLASSSSDVTPVFDVWRQPQVWPRHIQLRNSFLQSIHRGDTKGMEAISRAGVELMPEDPTWRYNHACALAYRESPESALVDLEMAVQLGFRNADAIEKDSDLARINTHPKFKKIVELARKLAGRPIPGRPETGPAYARYGGAVTLSSTNVVWDFDEGFFQTEIRMAGENNPSAQAANYGRSRPLPKDCPERPYVAAWLSEGTASGNGGDLYINRDRGHSMLATGDFPMLTSVRMPEDAKRRMLDVDLPNMMFKGNPAVFGNASRARKDGPFWRSNARSAMTDPYAAGHMNRFYLSNQFWVFPAHMDFGRESIGDVFPGRTPHTFVTVGSSWSDQPFLRAAIASAACFAKPTRQAILRRNLMGPTLQWILRRTLKGVATESDYLTPKAHPVAFAAKDLDVLSTVKFAHSLHPEHIPPAATLTLVNSKIFPVKLPVPIRDYPDPNSEILFATPTAIAFVLRGLEAERTFLVQAHPFPERDATVKYEWRVVGGDASAVTIAPPLGETLASPESGLAQITIDRRNIASRIDIAVFAKSEGTEWGAPSFITFMPIPMEKRTYDSSGRLVSIDNSNPEGRYTDPMVALPRSWKDTFSYSSDGRLMGYTRTVGDKVMASFTADGKRIVERNADGTPKKTVNVRYLPRAMRNVGNKAMPPELTYVDETGTEGR